MIIAHKFLEVLKGQSREMRLAIVPDKTAELSQSHLEAVIEGIELAEKFDFGELILEQGKDATEYLIPELTSDEITAWREGLIPLPSDICWYEFNFPKLPNRVGLLIVGTGPDEDRWSVQRYDWIPGSELYVDGIWVSVTRSEMTDTKNFSLLLHGNEPARREMDEKFRATAYGNNIPLAIYLTMMLYSRTTETVASPAPVALNKARAKKGRIPLPAHRIVRIVPERYLRERRKESGLTRLPPRMHYRRSHLRYYDHRTPKAKQLMDGRWAVLMPRMLVSKSADAEVSHEYFVTR